MADNNDSNSGGFTHIGHGTNSQGNHFCVRDYGKSEPGYHYSNRDGSYYYKNPDGSTYFNNGSDFAKYTSPGGHTTKTFGPSK
ncbi:hypothetical protein PAXINDRAFT_169772 [Paxillus involutus ATCC 200175]|uniref:Uncharacterized protein n=1 Tax=Paxillus involutus ATCC 200175 TaxID=664439 RepID=A0A0C9TVQ1_PAXIN|nr:hypothetical protein PAXINDRAFT_169772 [Paxillus involutus ATCC 200175]